MGGEPDPRHLPGYGSQGVGVEVHDAAIETGDCSGSEDGGLTVLHFKDSCQLLIKTG